MVDHSTDRDALGAPGQEPLPQEPVPAAGADDGGERIAKALARAGVASRREVERYIADGRVAVNGKLLTTPAVKIEPGDIITVDGAVIGSAEPTRLFRYHKPTGLVTTHVDPKGRPTVFSALPKGLPRVISIGRLDLATEGLLLLTNDGALSRALELPTTGLMRRYRARAFGDATQTKLDTLKDGITVEGVRYGAIDARLDKAKDGASGRNVWITLTLAEGKNREVRRVLEAIGLKVNRLIRLSYGPFALGTLAPGEVEEVGPRVIRELLAEHIAPANLPKGDKTAFKGGLAPAPARRSAVRGASPHVEAEKTAAAKPIYKPGWAKPKRAPARGPSAAPKGPRKPPRGAAAAPTGAAPGPRTPTGRRSGPSKPAGPKSRG